ncbi:MAG: gfo/Idh/MocA family oxidoreductase [Spirochaetaceae bacterium]|nr:MAG: gfo/Idh/MocA family oxidoreductase [Spirochaetaceae bacterium]
MSIKVAVVGVGNIGSIHAQIYADNKKSDLVAVCDIDREKADRKAGQYGCRAFYSVKEMLASGIKLDGASVATKGEENGGDHYQPTMELLRAAIPVLGEKPISNQLSEAREMVALAKEKKVPYAIDLNHRFTPAAAVARKWLDEGRLGTPHMVNMRMWINNPAETSPWFHLRALHPHSFDVLRYFCGDVESVACFCNKGEGRTIWSNAQILLKFTNGMIGNLAGSYDATGPSGSFGLEHVDVSGSEGRFLLEEACQALTYYPRRSMEIETYRYIGGMLHFQETFKSRIDTWIDQLSDGVADDKVLGSGREGLLAQEIIEAAILSWEERRIVSISEVQ